MQSFHLTSQNINMASSEIFKTLQCIFLKSNLHILAIKWCLIKYCLISGAVFLHNIICYINQKDILIPFRFGNWSNIWHVISANKYPHFEWLSWIKVNILWHQLSIKEIIFFFLIWNFSITLCSIIKCVLQRPYLNLSNSVSR